MTKQNPNRSTKQELNAMFIESNDPLLSMPEDDLGAPVSTYQAQQAQIEQNEKFGRNKPTFAVPASTVYTETCGKCGGDGIYKAPSSLGYQCFACDGKGVLTFKTSPETRAKAKVKAAEKKVKKEREMQAAFEAFEVQYPVVAAWWTNTTFEFAINMRDTVQRFGSLTPGQLAAATKCAEKFQAVKMERAAAQAVIVAAAPVVTIDHVQVAFANATEAGIKRPKLRLFSGEESFEFSKAPDSGKNAGAVYVTQDGQYLGKVMGGKFLKVRDCDTQKEAEVLKVCADPAQAAIAYGKQFGSCSACGRELSDPVSVERGIGPICEGRFFG
jgi:hypothetical protein